MNISFAHHKDGTGKTASCINVAGWLMRNDKNVLLVDVDPKAHATAGLGIDKITTGGSMYGVLIGDMCIREIVLKTLSRVHSPSSKSTLIEMELYEVIYKKKSSTLLRKALKAADLDHYYDYVLIDTTPDHKSVMVNALSASDQVIVTLGPGIFALESLDILWALFSELGWKGLLKNS